jgi:hypothetical protein
MATIRNISDSIQPTMEIELIGPRVEFLIPPKLRHVIRYEKCISSWCGRAAT